MSASSELTGWKEVAACLSRSVRSVQRYERELGLPVHRIRTANGQSVYAFRQEIEAWRQTREPQGAPVASASAPPASQAGKGCPGANAANGHRQRVPVTAGARASEPGRQVEPAAPGGPPSTASRRSLVAAALAGAVAGGLAASTVLWMVLAL